MNRSLIAFTILALSASKPAWAQPPEEVPPPPPEAGEVTVAPVPPALDQKPAAKAPAVAPVAEPKAVVKAEPEDKTVKGITISPAVSVYPIGYDNMNIGERPTGAPLPKDGGRFFFGLKPNIGLTGAFKTGTGKTVNFSSAYAMTWREYYNKDVTRRDFSNDFEASIGVEWTPVITTSLPAAFSYFYKAGVDESSDNGVTVDLIPTLGLKATDKLSFKLAYQLHYLHASNAPISLTDPPSDIDDIRGGGFASSSSLYDSSYGALGILPSDPAAATGMATDSFYEGSHTAIVGTSYSPIKGTKLSGEYDFTFAISTNNEFDGGRKGHVFKFSVAQDMPWKGGSVSLAEALRLRKFDYAVVPDASTGGFVPVQDLRNRLQFTFNQAINDHMGVETYLDYFFKGSNKDNYAKFGHRVWYYLGMNFQF